MLIHKFIGLLVCSTLLTPYVALAQRNDNNGHFNNVPTNNPGNRPGGSSNNGPDGGINQNTRVEAGAESRSGAASFSGSNSRSTTKNDNNNTSQGGSGSATVTNDPSVSVSSDGNNGGGGAVVTQEGDTVWYLPDPVDIYLPQNTEPGMSAVCKHLGVTIDYTGGNSTGVTLWVIGFANSNTPSEIPVQATDLPTIVATCGVVDQILTLLPQTNLTDSEKAAAQKLALDSLLDVLFKLQGKVYNPRTLELESVNR
jgi:hypothetical protein